MMDDNDEFRTESINLTAEQWVGLLDAEHGAWLPRCCASISAARDVLSGVLREGGCINVGQARKILCEIGNHHGADTEGLRAILAGKVGKLFWTSEGSPWFEIVRACRALLGDGNVIEEARERRKAEIAQAVTSKKEQRERDAKRIARAFHDAYERLAPSYGYETRRASAKPFGDIPENNKALMIATVSELLAHDVIEASDGQLPPPVEAVPHEPERVRIGVQINGMTIGTIVVNADASADEALRIALADYRVANHVRDAAVSIEKYKQSAVLRLVTA